MNLTLLLGIFIFSQYFGQNKIQYRDFNFNILHTEHFDIYFYQGGEAIAQFAEDVLEDGYDILSKDLGVDVDFTIPVILYKSPNDFSQTNVTLQLIEESVGGFTEILKNRMVIPFNGDYKELRHVLVHELTHVFQFVIFFPSRLEALFSGDIFYSIPLWVMEGNAEFESLEWDIETDIIIRDLIMNNKMIPIDKLENYGGYIIYKEGQAFYYYIAQRYGRKKVGEFLHLLKMKKNLRTAFTTLFGLTPEDFNKRWIKFYQRRYWPKIELQENFEKFARVVFNHKKTHSSYNTSATISPRGDKIAFISDQGGTAEIIVISSIDGQVIKHLVRSEYSAGYEGLHLYQGGLSWSRDGRFITFAAKSRGRDILYIIKARNGRVYKKFAYDLDGIYAPKFSPDGKKITFCGLKDSQTDIYICDIKSGIIEKVTDDIYTDKFPNFGVNESLVFVSDRPDSNEEYHYGSYALFLYYNGDIKRLTPRTAYLTSPFFGPDSGIYFVADYDSAYNLYYFSETENAITKKTNIFSGIYYPSASYSGNKIAFTHYNEYGYDICVVKDPLSKMEDCKTPEEKVNPATYKWSNLDSSRIKKYRTRFTFDYFIASASYYYTLGFSGVGQIALSDILGNHLIQFSSNFYGSLTSSDIFLNYWYLKKRTDYGLALYQYLNYFSEYPDLIIWRHLGIGGIMQYPFDRFFRAELGLYAYKVYETRWYDFFPYYYSNIYKKSSYNFIYPDVALVFDNAKWGATAPHRGLRMRLEAYATVFSSYKIRNALFDFRKYFPLSPRASFATRLTLLGSFGPDIDYWSIGGPNSLRGYGYYAFSGPKLGFLNLEYRFPFIDRLKLAFPLPIEIQNIRGVLFTDFGGVYTDSFTVYDTAGGFHLKDLKMGIGAGLRFTLMYIIFRLDFGRACNLQKFTDDWKFYFTLGPDW